MCAPIYCSTSYNAFTAVSLIYNTERREGANVVGLMETEK